jgi:prolipoprotein diacylglyceryltransferase
MLTETPSPARGVWHLGPLPIRAYALCILAGIVVAVVVTQRSRVTCGGRAEQVLDISTSAVPSVSRAGGSITC